jgi:biopolymer transport protein ExbD
MAGSVGSEDGDIGFQIAPMVDVVFVLMLFFMASAGSQVVEKELNVNLPAGQGSKSDSAITPVIIDISPEGAVSVNETNYGAANDKNLLRLKEFLKSAIGDFGTNDPVIIRPNPETKHERIIDVLNAAAFAQVKNLTFS